MLDHLTPTRIFLIAAVWLLNLGISFWNARAVGLAWVETKAVGGWPRFMAWMGAVMAASGFSWCSLIFGAIALNSFGYLPDDRAVLALKLGYVLLVPGVLFAGFAIMLDSWAQAFRSGRLADYGVAVYNTAANLHNAYDAWQSFGPALGDVVDGLCRPGRGRSSGDDDDDSGGAALMVIGLVVAALLIGILATAAIIRSYAGSRPIAAPSNPRVMDPDFDGPRHEVKDYLR